MPKLLFVQKDCTNNDNCNDTPTVDREVLGSVYFEGCSGEQIMLGNYRNYSDDITMNILQRIRHVECTMC